MQLNNFKRRKEDLLSFDKIQEKTDKKEDLPDQKTYVKHEVPKHSHR